MKTPYRIRTVAIAGLIALLILGPTLIRISSVSYQPAGEDDQEMERILTEIQRSLQKIEQSVETLAERKPQFEKVVKETDEIHKLRAEVSRLRSVQQENVALRDELLQTTEDLFTLSDLNQDLSHQLDQSIASTPSPRLNRDLPRTVRILDDNISPFISSESLGDSPIEFARGENGEFIFVNPADELESGLPGDTDALFSTLPDSHPTTTMECSACHTPQDLEPKETMRVRIRPRSAPSNESELRNILNL